MKYDEKETLYSCGRWMDGKFHIGIIEVVNGSIKVDTAGRNRGYWYNIRALNFVRDRKKDFKVRESDIDAEYRRTAVEAVGDRLGRLFDSYRKEGPPEARMMDALFGEKKKVKVAIEELPKVIRELQEFQHLFAEAVSIDAKRETNEAI